MVGNLDTYRHSTAHIIAQAVCMLYPGTKLGIGPAIEEGFYYDFDLPSPISPEDLPAIESKMKEIIKADLPFEKQVMAKDEAKKFFQQRNEIYKVELLDEIEDDAVNLYQQGEFIDLCRGPHVENTGVIKAFKLISIAGAYWRGNEKNPMLTRIYGTCFETKEELDNYLFKLEEAKRRDHRKIGKELKIFDIYDEVGPGLIYYHPKGAIIREEICSFLRKEHTKRGYSEVITPHIAKIDLWQISGHCDYYKDNMYFMEVDENPYVLKPMNCPGHILIYKSQTRSYKELPIRYFELGTVYRYERSGVLHGLLRVRGFTQDDAHIFCRPDQLKEEICGVIDFASSMLSTFGFKEYDVYLSTRPQKYVGTAEIWDEATSALATAMENKGLKYTIDEGEGVFYGPKIDIKLKDAIGRSWQGPTIQVDFNLPQRFNVTYAGADGNECQPVMIHRVVLGSLERFLGALIEHYAGAFPIWLCPIQVMIMTIADRHIPYAKKIEEQLLEKGVRVKLDSRNEKVGFKIREAETLHKVPYMLIIGDKEVEAEKVSVRKRGNVDSGQLFLKEVMDNLIKEINEKTC
ncbi:MAG: threonine--tRNA ligase [bacterium]|nr:threonine--tRNA ligase [bacterium]